MEYLNFNATTIATLLEFVFVSAFVMLVVYILFFNEGNDSKKETTPRKKILRIIIFILLVLLAMWWLSKPVEVIYDPSAPSCGWGKDC